MFLILKSEKRFVPLFHDFFSGFLNLKTTLMTPNQYAKLSATIAAIVLGGGSLQGQVTYVDANFSTNTTPGGAVTTTVDGSDNLWALRSFGTNGSIFEASGGENAPEIATTISGLISGGIYNIWVNFYDVSNDLNQNWPIRAGFNSGELTLFANGDDGGAAALDATPAGLASGLIYLDEPRFTDGSGRLLYAGFLGSSMATVNGEIVVFIDNMNVPGGGVNNRTWYDGVSYEVIPEPSTYAMMFGVLTLLYAYSRRRRNRY